jgi:hypothetical protein
VAGTASVETPRAVRPRLAGLLKAEPMLTHGSNCQRAWSGPLDALAVFSRVKNGVRTPPTLMMAMLLDGEVRAQQERCLKNAARGLKWTM